MCLLISKTYLFIIREIILQHKERARESLEKESDPATILHLVCIILFAQSTGLILNFPGRMVPNVLEFVKNDIIDEAYTKLVKFQGSFCFSFLVHEMFVY